MERMSSSFNSQKSRCMRAFHKDSLRSKCLNQKSRLPSTQFYRTRYFGQKFIHSITVALNCGIRWIHHTIFHNTVGLGDHQVKAMHQMMHMIFQSCLLDISIETTNLCSCGSLLGQILRPLLLIHLHQHPFFIRQVLLNVCYLSWNCPNWNYYHRQVI